MGQDAEGNTEVAEKDYDDGDDEKNETIKVPPFWFVVKKFLFIAPAKFQKYV